MRAPIGILQCNLVLFATPATVFVGRAAGKEAAEDAMLGVEDGKVLIDDGLNPIGSCLLSEQRNLTGVQILSGGKALQ